MEPDPPPVPPPPLLSDVLRDFSPDLPLGEDEEIPVLVDLRLNKRNGFRDGGGGAGKRKSHPHGPRYYKFIKQPEIRLHVTPEWRGGHRLGYLRARNKAKAAAVRKRNDRRALRESPIGSPTSPSDDQWQTLLNLLEWPPDGGTAGAEACATEREAPLREAAAEVESGGELFGSR